MRMEERKRRKERRTRIGIYIAFALVALLYLIDRFHYLSGFAPMGC